MSQIYDPESGPQPSIEIPPADRASSPPSVQRNHLAQSCPISLSPSTLYPMARAFEWPWMQTATESLTRIGELSQSIGPIPSAQVHTPVQVRGPMKRG